MKKSEFRSLIREEIKKVLNENYQKSVLMLNDPKVKDSLKKLLAARKKDPYDSMPHDMMKKYLLQLFTKMKLKDPKSFADYMMEDEELATGTLAGVIGSIKFALEDEEFSDTPVKRYTTQKFNRDNISFPG